MSKTISGLPLAETLTGDELLPVVQDGNTVQATVQQMADLVGNTTTWGDIQGTLSNQTDLQTALDAKVPYSGATGNVNLGEYGLTSGYFQADLTPTNALQVGRMQWNDQDGTMDLRLKGDNVTLQIGQEQLIRVVNKTGATLTETDYQCVKISGAQGQRPKVDLAQANNDANSADTIGLVTETILDNQEGFVTTSGLVRNINTTGSMQGETWADGDVLYLSGTTAGQITKIKPQAPIHTVIVGFVIYAHANQGKIYVKVDNGYELDELHNVKINGVTDGQVLAYDSTLSVWENINQSAITSGNSDKVDGYHVQVDGTGTDPNTIYFKTTGGVDPSAAVWGDITGSIVDQTDLYNALVNGTYATGNWNINAASVDGYSVQVDGTGTDPNTIYFKTTGGTISVDWDDVANTPTTVSGYGITDAVTTSGNQTIGGTKTFSSTITGSITGNADTVDGYNVQVDGTGTDPNTIYFKTTGGTTSVEWGNISGTLSAQTDLQTALDGKYSTSNPSGYITASALTPYAPINNPTFTGTVGGITKAMVGLGNVDNTADAVKSVSYAASSGNADTVDGYNVQVDGTGTDPNTIYFKTTGGSISVEWDDVSNTPTTVAGYGITDAVTTSGDQTVGGTKTFSSTITGSITGNAGTVTNGVYTSGDQTIGGTKTFSSTISGSIDGNSNTVDGYHVQVDGTGTDPNTIYFKTTGGSIGVDWDDISNTPTTVAGYGITDAVTTSGNQTIGGTKTFSSTITGSITGNAGTVTNGVYTTGDQTIGGNKTFTGTTSITNGPLVLPTSAGTNSFISGTGDGASLSTYNFALSGWNGMAFYNPTVGGVFPTSTTGVVNFRDGIIEMRGSLRAPIFYDSADTSYYLDPANTGTSMAVAGNVGIGTNSPDKRLDIEAVGSNTAIRMKETASYGVSWDIDVGSSNAMTFTNNAGSPLSYIFSNGKVLVGAGATASLGKLVVSEASSGTAIIALESQGSWNSTIACTSTGNLVLRNNGASDRMVFDPYGNIITYGPMFASIYYDNDNSAFYVNPNGTSNISALVMNDLLTGRSSASTDVNGANDTGSFSVRGSSTTVASMSFHRTGAYAINMGLGTDNVFRIGGWSASNNCLQMDGSGNLTMLNNVTAYSDARLKTDVVKIENALDKVQQLNGYTYTRTDTGSKQTGVIAQEVMKVLPEVVMGSEDTHYSVAYGNMVGLLIEAIKEQQGQINELKLTIEQLKGN